ncbi:MAG TPA: FAD-binding oxidoreductase [Candidatus Acidoferrales bacterium]|nr:FAD-binding oxidoreductase [Candidatus Acidoferrales bacterium]
MRKKVARTGRRERKTVLKNPAFKWDRANWGIPPWTIEFRPLPRELPESVDYAVIGGGFAGLSAAAWLARLAPGKRVALFEAATIGAGASGRTGGLVLAETAVGDLPGLGDVLKGYAKILRDLKIEAELELPGVFELSHSRAMKNSPIRWKDSGTMAIASEAPGGAVNPGKVLTGLARAAEVAGAMIFENAPVTELGFASSHIMICAGGREIHAKKILIATNAESLELGSLEREAQPKFTLGVATEPLSEAVLESLGLKSRKPFYTEDLPYLWGRLLADNSLVLGAGLVHLNDWREFDSIDVHRGETKRMFDKFEERIHEFHPVLERVKITHRWGGPILFPKNWLPVFRAHPRGKHAIVLQGFSGHGVALSVYLGQWAAKAMLGRRKLPAWKLPHAH